MSFLTQKPPTGILIAQAVGITTSAFLAGQNAGFSYTAVPALLLAPAPLAARQWRKAYDIGKKVGPVLAVIGTLSAGYLAYNDDTSSLPFKLNLAATLLFPSIVPYTIFFMGPINSKLSSKAQTLATTEITDKAAEAGVAREETVHALIDSWATWNMGRALITAVGSVCVTIAALDKLEYFGAKVALKTGADRLG